MDIAKYIIGKIRGIVMLFMSISNRLILLMPLDDDDWLNAGKVSLAFQPDYTYVVCIFGRLTLVIIIKIIHTSLYFNRES